MKLKYEFVVMENESCLGDIQRLLREEYDFVYSPFIPCGQKLFRESFPAIGAHGLPLKVLLFKYSADEGADHDEHVAVQDINSSLEYAGILGMDSTGCFPGE